ARRTSLALARLTARRALTSGGDAFGRRIGGGFTEILVTLASPSSVPFALLGALSRYSVSGRRLRAILPRLLAAMTIAIVARTPLIGPTTWPPDLNHLGRGVRRSDRRVLNGRGLGRCRVLGSAHGIDGRRLVLRAIDGWGFSGIG